jgi:hypothetical protein
MTTQSVKSGEAIAEGSVKPQHKGSKQNKTKQAATSATMGILELHAR